MSRLRKFLHTALVGLILVSALILPNTAASIQTTLDPKLPIRTLFEEVDDAKKDENTVLVFAIGSEEYFANGETLPMDVGPVIIQDRTFLPIRYVAEPLGAALGWVQEDKKATVSLEETIINLWIGKSDALINNKAVPIDKNNDKVTPVNIDGRTMLPLRFVSEALGCAVQWDPETQRAAVVKTGPKSDIKEIPDVLKKPETIPGIIRLPKDKLDFELPGKGSSSGKIEIPGPKVPDLKLGRRELKPGENLTISKTSLSALARPVVQLSNGKEYLLQPASEPIFQPNWSAFVKTDLKSIIDQVQLLPPLATVDLRKYQTSIKDQEGRGTCVSHALCAAMEAAYKRLDPVKYGNLDLSEQYMHLVQKTQALKGEVQEISLRENALGRWGGANMHYITTVFSTISGVPEEKYHPYIGDKPYEKEPTDKYGLLLWEDETLRQDRVNNMNLSLADLPIEAITNATYGITGWGALNDNELNKLDYYRSLLRAEREIMFGIPMRWPDPTPKDNVWDPGKNFDPEEDGYHAMLMVGYDDEREVFIVKNSWGYDNVYESGYTLMSYDWVTKGHVIAAIFINSVKTDTNYNDRTATYSLGQWSLVSDGTKSGRLDVSHIPQFFHKHFPADKEVFGPTDNRIGLFNVPLGNVLLPRYYRVNGRISGLGIDFWLNFDEPKTKDHTELTGTKYTGCVFRHQPTLMAGYYEQDGQKYGFYASKDKYLESVPQSTGKEINLNDFNGTWELNHNGEIGTLMIWRTQNILLNRITGIYTDAAGKTVEVSGGISGNKLTVNIPFEDDYVQKFEGYMHAGDKGLISGQNNYRYGLYFGWIARRTGGIELNLGNDQPIIIPNLPIFTK